MKKQIFFYIAAVAGLVLISATNGFSSGSFGTNVNTACTPLTPYTGDCTLCHLAGQGFPGPVTDAQTAYLAGGTTRTDFFCPCTDADADTYAATGSPDYCGPDFDCNDGNAAINPGAVENCTDGIDNNCNGLVDALDPAAVGCSATCTDNDGDTYATEGGDCGLIDCDDTNAAINPGAVENCTDGIDNNCNGLVDDLDPAAVGCTNPDINLSPGTLDFGAVAVGNVATLDTAIQNLGTLDLNVSAIALCTGTSTEFTWNPAAPFTVAPSTSQTLSVTYTPVDDGIDIGCLEISSNDPDEAVKQLTLNQGGSILQFTPAFIKPKPEEPAPAQ